MTLDDFSKESFRNKRLKRRKNKKREEAKRKKLLTHRKKKNRRDKRRKKVNPELAEARKARTITRHHLIPRSRGGTNDRWNIKAVDALTHERWHKLFLNWKPDEIIKMLGSCGRSVFVRDSRELKNVWGKLFNNKSNREVIEIIKNEWSPKNIDEPAN